MQALGKDWIPAFAGMTAAYRRAWPTDIFGDRQ